MRLMLKGFIIGIGKIVPGVSGAMLAITLGVYDKAIQAFTGFTSDIKKNFKYLLLLGIGIISSIIVFSKIINYFYNNHYIPTMLFFMGLIIGGIPGLINKTSYNYRNIIITSVSFLIVTILSFSFINNTYMLKGNFVDYIILFIGGITEAFSSIVPGISGTALFMVMGIYNIVIEMLANLTNVFYVIDNFLLIVFFIIGLLLGVILISILVKWLFSKYSSKTYSAILGFFLSNVVILFLKIITYSPSLFGYLIGIPLSLIGYFIGKLCK